MDETSLKTGKVVKSDAEWRTQLTPEQFERLRSELEAGFQGAANAGRPLLLEGGLDWKAMSLSPKDLDFVEAKNAAAREIALAMGVPPMLLGIPGDNTYANFQEANRALWRQTVLPLVTRTARALAAWLAPGEALELRPDLDAIEALAPEREALWSRLEAASFLSAAEKRAAAGYGEGDAEPSAKAGFSPAQPRDEAGRWRESEGGAVPVQNRHRRGGWFSPRAEARLASAEANARLLERRVRALDPTWRSPQSIVHPDSIEGRIRHNETIAAAAEARLAYILRDKIPGFSPNWSLNRLRSELHDHGFIFIGPTSRSEGWRYSSQISGAEVRIMVRPKFRNSTMDPEKFYFGHYYRYRPHKSAPWGAPTPIPD